MVAFQLFQLFSYHLHLLHCDSLNLLNPLFAKERILYQIPLAMSNLCKALTPCNKHTWQMANQFYNLFKYAVNLGYTEHWGKRWMNDPTICR